MRDIALRANTPPGMQARNRHGVTPHVDLRHKQKLKPEALGGDETV
jgi:hypothetical protein